MPVSSMSRPHPLPTVRRTASTNPVVERFRVPANQRPEFNGRRQDAFVPHPPDMAGGTAKTGCDGLDVEQGGGGCREGTIHERIDSLCE